MPPTHMERPEWKGMTGIRRSWVDDHNALTIIQTGYQMRPRRQIFAFASGFVFLDCICVTGVRLPNKILDVH